MPTIAEIKPPRVKKNAPVIEEEKAYEFELVTSYESRRPKDKEDRPLGSGYPPSFTFPNSGIAYDELTKKTRNWRYIEGQPSIWVDEQPSLDQYEKRDIHQLLGQEENQLEFRDGKMMIVGIQKLRLQALMNMDYFDGKTTRYRQVNKQYYFRLNNPDAAIQTAIDAIQINYDAMQVAMNCTVEEMLAASFTMGINIDDQSDAGLNRIKKEFLLKAQYDHKNPKGIEWFHTIMNNPATRITYVFSQGLIKGIISANQQPGKLTWAKPNTAILDLSGKINTADELTARAIDREELVLEVMGQIEKQLK